MFVILINVEATEFFFTAIWTHKELLFGGLYRLDGDPLACNRGLPAFSGA